jgi:TonB family protein
MKSAQNTIGREQPFQMATAFGAPWLGAALVVHWPLRQVWKTRPVAPFVSEIRESGDDYQSGPRRPRSKGFADMIGARVSIKRLAVLVFALLPGQIFGLGKAIAATRQVEELTVVSTSAPVYPPIARAANVQGEVIVSVTVNDRGDVVTALAMEGHPLLRKAAEAAALKWKFNLPSQTRNARVGSITFSFKFEFEEAVEVKDDISFAAPGRLEIIRKIPTVLPIQKVDGRIPEGNCPLHGQKMRVGIANILYGLPASEIVYPNDLAHLWQNIRRKIRRRFSYNEAAGKHFPESNLLVLGGCEVRVERSPKRCIAKVVATRS